MSIVITASYCEPYYNIDFAVWVTTHNKMLKGGPHMQSIFMLLNDHSVALVYNVPNRLQSATLFADLINPEWRMSSTNEMTLARQVELQVLGFPRSRHVHVLRHTKAGYWRKIWLRRQRCITLLNARAFITQQWLPLSPPTLASDLDAPSAHIIDN